MRGAPFWPDRSTAGVIIKCEHKQFADGTTGMTAVAQFEEAG